MDGQFFEKPILNSPYDYPARLEVDRLTGSATCTWRSPGPSESQAEFIRARVWHHREVQREDKGKTEP